MIKRIAKFFVLVIVGMLVVCLVWWVRTAPPEYLQIAPAYVMGEVPASIVAVTAPGDPIGDTMETVALEIRGYDDVVLPEDRGRAFVTGRDGWIWIVDLETGEAEHFVDAPLMASGALERPGVDDQLCFCASYLFGETYPENERVGLYQVDINTKEITTLVLRVPLPPDPPVPASGNQGTFYTRATEKPLAVADMDDTNSRPIVFCNDVDVSSDGQRFYFSEPFSYEGASMGGGAVGEAITLGNNGRLWKYDAEAHTVSLVAHGYHFVDGVLLEESEQDGAMREHAVLITETTKFRILRLNLEGDHAGQDEVVWDALPAMPDGLERDAAGNIWVGMIKQRSGVVTWAHAHPWIKPLMLRLPLEMLPVPTITSVMALSPDGSEPLWYAEHPGTKIQDIAAVIPGEKWVYLANFTNDTPGLHRIPNPLLK